MHSIIIPHRGRELHLELCLWALERSARACGIDDFELIVVDDPLGETPFNKSRAMNLGIDRAAGEVLTFLDADAIVGRRFMGAALCLEDASLDRCCYRVRKLPITEDLRIETACDRDAYVEELFADYRRYPLAYEAYGLFCCDLRSPPHPRGRNRDAWEWAMASGIPWGNSQFSITRQKLGDLRYDEEVGWFAEDVDMLLQLQAKFGRSYRGRIFTEPEQAMFHIDHAARPWNDRNTGCQRAAIHRRKRKQLLGW